MNVPIIIHTRDQSALIKATDVYGLATFTDIAMADRYAPLFFEKGRGR